MPLAFSPAAALLLILPLVSAGCGRGGPRLEGSLSELLPLGYERAVVQPGEAELRIRFVRTRGAGEDTVLELAADLSLPEEAGGGALSWESPVDLSELSPAGHPRGVVTRNVENDPRQTFPAIARGTLSLNAAPTPGATVDGTFHVTFAQGTLFGSGRTVFADFEARVP